MTEAVLHHVAASRSFRTLWLLVEMGIEPSIHHYKITDGSLRDPAFLAKSPAGRVPALEIDGRVLFESSAIAQYLTETRPEHGFGRGLEHPERQLFLEWLSYAETMAGRIEALNLSWVFLRDPATRSDIICKIEARRLELSVAPLEDLFGRQDYLLASGFSAADTMLGYNFMAVPYYVRLEPYPHLRRYIERIEARPGFQRARALDGTQEFYTQDFYEVAE